MRMKRKSILMHYLMIASSVMIGLILVCCSKTDYRADSDWVYVNNSSYELNIVLGHGEYDGPETNFILPANSNHTVELRSDATTDDLQATDFRSPYQYHGATVEIENRRYSIEPGDGLADVFNYQHQKLAANYFQFTYTFTDEVIRNIMSSGDFR